MSLIPPDPGADQLKAQEDVVEEQDSSLSLSKPLDPDIDAICTADHCFHAFDALYCALTSGAKSIAPHFANDK